MRNFSMSVDEVIYNFSIKTTDDTIRIIIDTDVEKLKEEQSLYHMVLNTMLRNSVHSLSELSLTEEILEIILREMFQRDARRANDEIEEMNRIANAAKSIDA